MLEGPGTHVTGAGRTNEGTFKAGKLEGEGESSHPEGARFKGTFKAGRPHGNMSVEYPDGSSSTGSYKDGQQHGKSTRTFANGDTVSGNYENGTPVGKFTRVFSDESMKQREEEALKPLPDDTIKALKKGNSEYKAWEKVNKKYGDDISRLEVLVFNDENHYDEARESGELSDNSVHEAYKTWDEVKDSVRPGMFLEFTPSVDAEALSDKLTSENVSDKKIQNQLDKLEDLTEYTLVVPKTKKVDAKESGYFSDDMFVKASASNEKALKDAGLGDWTNYADIGQLAVKSPDGSVTIQDSGKRSNKRFKVFKDDTLVSAHPNFKSTLDSAKETHESDDFSESAVDDVTSAGEVSASEDLESSVSKSDQEGVDSLMATLNIDDDDDDLDDLLGQVEESCE